LVLIEIKGRDFKFALFSEFIPEAFVTSSDLEQLLIKKIKIKQRVICVFTINPL